MNNHFDFETLKVFSNLEGRTLMSVKPNFNKQNKSKTLTKFKFNLNFSKLNTNDENVKDFSKEYCETEANEKPKFEFNLNNLPNLTTRSSIEKNKITFYRHLSDQSTTNKFNNKIKNDSDDLFIKLKEKDKLITNLQEKLKVKEITIQNLENKVKSLNKIYKLNNTVLELNNDPISSMNDFNNLILDLKSYLHQDITYNNYNTPEESLHIKKSILTTLSNLNENILSIKKHQENKTKSNLNKFQDLKQENEKLKQKELKNQNLIEKYKLDLEIIEKEKFELMNGKKVERVRRVIEATSDTLIAKENADLQRRLEIASKFLLKKKEKIEKMNEKINVLNKKINDMIKSQTFSENEEEKIKEKLSKKLKNENHPIIYRNDTKIFNIDLEKKNLEFRVDKLKEKYKDLMKDIIENGTNEFVKHFFTVDKTEQEKLLEFVCDHMLSQIEFSKKLNEMSNYFIDSLNFTKDELILFIRLKFVEIFECERVTLWVYDQRSNEFFTLVNFERYSENRNNQYFINVLEGGVYNKYNKQFVSENDFYSENLEKIFSSKQNVRSVLSIPIVDNNKNQIYGIIEAINSHNILFGYDEEYLMNMLSIFIRWFLIKFSIEEADTKHKTKDSIYSSIINIMLQKTLNSICNTFEKEINHLINSYKTRIILIDLVENKNNLFYFIQDSDKKIIFSKSGIASLTIKSQTGIYCKYPNEDENYNPLIDIECHEANFCFYSIPIRREGVGIFAIIQFITERDESSEIQYKSTASHHVSKLDYYREKIIDIMSQTLQNSILNIIPTYFNL